MKGKILLLLFAIVALVSIPVHVVPGQSEEWLSIEDEFFVINYKEGYRSDAELILEYCRFARKVTMEAYPHELEVKVKVYLYDYGSWKDPPWVTRADPTKAEMFFLTPSDQPPESRRWCDDFWYQKNVVHEYVHIPTSRDIDNSGYKIAPYWVTEGIAEYIAVFHTTEEIMQKYSWALKNIEDMVKKGDGYLLIVCGDVYYGGAYILKYMYETYGKDKIVAFFMSDAKSFIGALEKELEVTYYEFEENWLNWACEEFNVDPNLYVRFESYEGKRLYEELLSDYNELNTTYHKLTEDYASLNSSYYDLQVNQSDLLSRFNGLKRDYDSLNSSYNSLLAGYDSLKANYDGLESRYKDLKSKYQVISELGELGTTRSLMYIFIITTIAFIVTTVYFTRRKPKTT